MDKNRRCAPVMTGGGGVGSCSAIGRGGKQVGRGVEGRRRRKRVLRNIADEEAMKICI